MLRVALTGGIATGKSYVAGRFRTLGVPVVDADAIVHRILAARGAEFAQIVARFGTGILDPAGAIDRRALGAIVFGNAAARRDLEAILHPAVYRLIEEWFAGQRGRAWAVADVPLLYETGRERDFDRVVVTACTPERQIARIVVRDGTSIDEARARLAAQWPIEEKVGRADLVIRTDGTFEETDRQVDEFATRLSREAAPGL